jgi:endo-1,4-beta-xylanase
MDPTVDEVGGVSAARAASPYARYQQHLDSNGALNTNGIESDSANLGTQQLSGDVMEKLGKLLQAVMKLVTAQIQQMLEQFSGQGAGHGAGMPGGGVPAGPSKGAPQAGPSGGGGTGGPVGGPSKGAGGAQGSSAPPRTHQPTKGVGNDSHDCGPGQPDPAKPNGEPPTGSVPPSKPPGAGNPATPGNSNLKPDAGDMSGGPSLKRNAAQHGMYMGTAVNAQQIQDPEFTAKAKNQFNTVTPENEMKWGEIAQKGYGPADKIVDWAADNGMKVRGHTLAWHSQAPEELNNMSGDQVKQAMTNHIDKTVKHFGDKVGTWDVVNEAFADGNGGRFRDSQFSRAMGGQKFLDEAFIAARKAGGPDKELVLNDYAVETKNDKSDAMYNAVKSMKERGIPIDTVGFQAHVTAGDDLSSMAANIKRFKDLGVNVQITELDVKGGDDAAKAATARDVWKAAIEGGASGVTTWGVSDKDSWLNSQGNLGTNAGLPFDANMNLKPEMLRAMG